MYGGRQCSHCEIIEKRNSWHAEAHDARALAIQRKYLYVIFQLDVFEHAINYRIGTCNQDSNGRNKKRNQIENLFFFSCNV